MKKLSFAGALVGAALLTTTPLSVHWSSTNSGLLAVTFATAEAADLAYPHRVYCRGYYRTALYDPYCGGPYVGPGWHGGSYWGGPWMDLRCYGPSW
jgi:hypothetical protein